MLDTEKESVYYVDHISGDVYVTRLHMHNAKACLVDPIFDEVCLKAAGEQTAKGDNQNWPQAV